MNIRDFIQVFSLENVLNGTNGHRTPLIILSFGDFDKTLSLTKKVEETRGVLFYRKDRENKDYYIVMAMLETGDGNSVSVFHDPVKFEAINHILTECPNYGMMEYHVHTEHTGRAFYNNFSAGDLVSLGKNVVRMPHYMHVLFTPENVCTFGLDSPAFTVPMNRVIEHEAHIEEWQKIFKKLQRILAQ